MPAPPANTVKRPARQNPRGQTWAIAAVLLTSAVSLSLMFLPLVSTTTSAGGTEQTARESLIENQGWVIAAVLAVPVLISAVPLLVPARHRRWATIGSAMLLATGAVVGAASVGLFYLPSVALLVVAAARTGKQR
jgi:hypothetical protein